MKVTHILCAIIVLLSSAACSVIAPPPMIARHVTQETGNVGDLDLTVVGGASAPLFGDLGVGGGVQVVHQSTTEIAWGAQAGGGVNVEPGDQTGGDELELEPERVPDFYYSARVFGAYNPGGQDYLRLTAGAGFAGLDTGNFSATGDLGVILGYKFLDMINPYVALNLALSLPLVPGEPLDEDRTPRTTFFYGPTLGLAVDVSDRVQLSGEYNVLFSENEYADDDAVMALSAGLRYRF